MTSTTERDETQGLRVLEMKQCPCGKTGDECESLQKYIEATNSNPLEMTINAARRVVRTDRKLNPPRPCTEERKEIPDELPSEQLQFVMTQVIAMINSPDSHHPCSNGQFVIDCAEKMGIVGKGWINLVDDGIELTTLAIEQF
jgi:hypothetical protein